MDLSHPALRTSGWVAAFAVLALLPSHLAGPWDWDTHHREILFHAAIFGGYDTHRLYEWLLAFGMQLTAPREAMVLLNAIGATAAAGALAWSYRTHFGKRAPAAAWLALLASPGLVFMVLTVEDNVLAWAPMIICFELMTRKGPKTAALAGVALAVAMHMGIVNLVVLFAVLAAPLLVWTNRDAAVRLVWMTGTALAAYYAVQFALFSPQPIALHRYFETAVELQDFGAERPPTFAWQRVRESEWGLSSMVLTPTFHLLQPTDTLVFWMRRVLPAAWLALVVGLVSRRAVPWATLQSVWPLAGIAVAFPYLYEPSSVERWDLFWLWVLVMLPRLWTTSRLLTALIVVQAGCTVFAISHHRLGALRSETHRAALELVEKTATSTVDVALEPAAVADHFGIWLQTRMLPGDLIFVGPRTSHLYRPLAERPLDASAVQQRLEPAQNPYIHVEAARLLARQEGQP